MKKRTREHGLSGEQSKIPRGFELYKQHKGDRFAVQSMNTADAKAYQEAMVAIEQAMEAQRILRNDFTPEHAAKIFANLAKKLHAVEVSDETTRRQIEQDLACIASLFALGTDTSGIGNVLQAARDANTDRLAAYIERIRSGTIRPIILQASECVSDIIKGEEEI